MAQCPKCGNRFVIKQRSLPQNSTYWGFIVEPLANEMNIHPNECHEFLKDKFNSEVKYVKNKKDLLVEIKKIRSTTVLTTSEFNDYCMHIRIWAAEQGWNLVEPNEAPINENI